MTTEHPTIVLRQPKPAFGVPNPSPFCIKLETWLKIAGLPYRTKICADPRKGPKGKIPFIEIGGEVLGDSELIIEALKSRLGVDPDDGLDPAARAAGHALTRMVEEHLYWAVIYSRWMEDGPFELLRAEFFSGMPPVVRSIAPGIVRKQVRKQLSEQGLGRHDAAEIYAKAEADLQAASDVLGEQPFFLGSEPRTADAAAYGVLTSAIDATVETTLTPIARRFDNLVTYTARMRERYFAETAEKAAA